MPSRLPSVSWLATERDKLAHFTVLLDVATSTRGHAPSRLRHRRRDVRPVFPDKLPIGMQTTAGAHLRLSRDARRPGGLPGVSASPRRAPAGARTWAIRLRSRASSARPRRHTKRRGSRNSAVRSALHRRRTPVVLRARDGRLAANRDQADRKRYLQAPRAFGAPRYRVLYRAGSARARASSMRRVHRCWPTPSPRHRPVETQILAHPYLHLSSLVGTA